MAKEDSSHQAKPDQPSWEAVAERLADSSPAPAVDGPAPDAGPLAEPAASPDAASSVEPAGPPVGVAEAMGTNVPAEADQPAAGGPPTIEQEAVPQAAAHRARHDTVQMPLTRRGKPKRRRHYRWIVPVAPLLVLAGAYGGLAFYFAGQTPAGTKVAGIDIGSMKQDQAIAKLEDGLRDKAKAPITVKVGDQTGQIDPVVSGLAFDAAATVEPISQLSFRPIDLWHHISGEQSVKPAIRLDAGALEAAIVGLANDTAVPPTDATLSLANGEVETTAPAAGQKLDQKAATSYVKENWLEAKEPWTLPVVEVAPNIDQAELDQAVKTIAEPLLSGPVTVKVDTSSVELPVEEVAAAAQIEPSEGHLVLSFNAELLMASVSKQSPVDLLTEPQDAHFAIVDGVPQIEDGVAGEGVDPDQLVDQVAKAAISTDQRVATVELIKTDPAAGRAELEKMGVKEQVSRFETIAPYNPTRTRNLVKAAELVSGTLVKPGETFSLDQALGHRSAENGWTSAGVVINGKMEEGIGGGLSQFSTTLYNASFLAGMEDVEHTPHSNWFSRYPKGREATLWEGMLDNKFKNNTPYGVVLVAGVTSDNVVWVELWSTKYWAVEAGFGEPYNYTAPRTIEDPSADCKPQAAGGSGFTIEFWRKLTLAGEVKEERTWKHTYSPINAYKCTKEG